MPSASFHPSQTAGHANFFPTTSVSGSPDVFINGGSAINVGSPFIIHCNTQPIPVYHPLSAASGSSSVFINGQPACRIGDNLDCGDTLASGSSNVFIGG